MAVDSSRSRATADSYIGSAISLTSKSEIRYEGILYNINTDESSIGLRNVRSFGTEGRKKDGPQIPASDKIYEYILFRGSDIKDLQVKSAPPAPIHNDPAVIQSHFQPVPAALPSALPSAIPAAVPASTSMPFVGSGAESDSTQTSQLGLPRSSFQGGPPLYQPGGALGSWGATPPPPPTATGSGLGMPAMYWQGYYAPSGGIPHHLQQPPFLRQPPGLPILQDQVQQPLQYPGMNPLYPPGMPNLSEYSHSLLPPVSSSFSLTSAPSLTSFSSPSSVLPSETSSSMIPNKPPPTFLPSNPSSIAIPPFVPPPTSIDPVVNNSENISALMGTSKPKMAPPSTTLSYHSISQPVPSSVVGSFISNQIETSAPLVTSVLASSQPSQESFKDLEGKLPDLKNKPSVVAEPQARVHTVAPALETKEPPILPLPQPADPKPNGFTSHTQQSYRRRGRGRGQTFSSQVTRFTEDFDFTAMNEKFNKDEVWGHLGKTKVNSSRDAEYVNDEEDDEDDDGSSDNRKPVYVKDDFFDMLSCNTTGRNGRSGRLKFSEQIKVDTETFGDFPRHRTGRGGGRGGRGGGGPSRGSYYGKGDNLYAGRGRRGQMQSRPAPS